MYRDASVDGEDDYVRESVFLVMLIDLRFVDLQGERGVKYARASKFYWICLPSRERW